MNNITIDDLFEVVNSYNACEANIIRRAYDYAYDLHKCSIYFGRNARG